jgi:tRNA(adenine34) deaminase
MEQALALAVLAGEEDEVPVGALVIKDGAVVGRGHNLRETRQSPIAHAEILAIEDAARSLGSWRLEGCRLFVTLEPCPMCLAACQQARVEEVVYAAVDPKGGALSLGYRLHEDVRLNHRFGVNRHEHVGCGEILSRFFLEKRSKKIK